MANEFLDIPSYDELDISTTDFPEAEDVSKLKLVPGADVQSKEIVPLPGFCLKTKYDGVKKVFINICHCTEVPKPPDITKDELANILGSDDPSSYRVPISIGEAHEEVDKSGKACICYDVVINSEFFEMVKQSDFFCAFLVTLCCECVGEKFNIPLSNEQTTILKNKSYHGKMPKHFIRSKPFIAELNSEYNEKSTKKEAKQSKSEKHILKPEVSVLENKQKNIVPKYALNYEPENSNCPDNLLLEINLPNVVTGQNISVQVGKARFFMFEKPNNYSMDIKLPFLVCRNSSSAIFDVFTKALSVTMPVDKDTLNNKCLCISGS